MRRPSLRSLAHDAHLPRVLVVYVSVGVGVLQTADVLQDRLGLPGWFFPAILALLLVGLPLVVATALAQAARGRAPSASGSAATLAVAVEPGSRDVAGGRAAMVEERPPASAAAQVTGRGHARLLTWRNATLAGGTAFGLLAASTAGYMGMRVAGIGPAGTLLGKGVLQPRDRVVVADVANRTDDRQLGAVVTEALRTQLQQSPSLTVVPAADIRAALVRMQQDSTAVLTEGLALEVAQRLGAKAVVTGEIGAAGSGYLLSAHVLAADSAAPLVSVLEQADEPDRLIAAIDRLSGRLRERVGESLRSIRASPPLAQVTTSSLPALRLYSEATRLLSYRLGEEERVLAMLQAAVSLDTGFASAYRVMGVVLINRGQERARAMAFMRRALERSDRLPLAERLRMQALYDWNRGDYDRAGTAYRALLELNPADGGALNNLGGTYADRGDPIRADSCFRAALRLDPEATAPAYNHILVLLALRQYDSARAYLGRRSAPLDVAVLYPTTLLKAATEPAESLLAFARRARAGARDAQAAMFAETAEMNALWASGRMREGDVHESALVPRYRSQGLNAAALEMALARASTRVFVQGDVSGAAAAVDSALAEWPLAGLPAVDRPHLPLASSLALAGRPAAARRALEGYRAALRAAEVIPEPAGEELASGLIALAEGRPADAVTDLRQAHDLPMPTGLPARYCRSCATLGLARAYDALGAPDSAIAAYERFTDQPQPDRFWILFALAPAHERLSDLYAARGDRNRSALHGAAFLRLWERADPALQPRVVAMRRRLEQLGTDRPLPR